MSTVMLRQKFGLVMALLSLACAFGCANKSGNESAKAVAAHTLKGTVKQTLTADDDGVRSVAFSPDGTTVASGGLGHAVKLWDVQTGSLKRTLEETGPPVVFSPDGKTLATVDGFKNTIRLWNAQTGA